MASSQVTYRTSLTKLNKSSNPSNSRFFKNTATPQQKNRILVIKKIIMISSIKKQVKKIFIKLIDLGIGSFCEQIQQKIESVAKTILNNNRQRELSENLQILSLKQYEDFYLMIFKLIKTFVISPLQKSFIQKIEKQLKQDEQLEHQIRYIQCDIVGQKRKNLYAYEQEKSGVNFSKSQTVNPAKQAQNFENKLMRANQNLNQLSSNNNKLRQKIDQLRKQKNAIEDIYLKLKKQLLQKKKQNVQNTIKKARQAYCARNQAQQDLKRIEQQAQQKKQQFKQKCSKLNDQIHQDIRFKRFIKLKLVQKQHLQKLQQQIRHNQQKIQIKKQQNSRIDNEFQKSITKEMEIKQCFDRIRKQITAGEILVQNQEKQLVNVFVNLYQKNAIMKVFVEEITNEVKEIQDKIQQKKQTIQKMYLKSSADQGYDEKVNTELKNRFQQQERKKSILDEQCQKSAQTIKIIKKCLQDIFQQMNMDSEVTNKLRNSNINEQNLPQFLAELQKKGLQAISSYGRLVSEQLRAQKGGTWQIQKQIDKLNGIIALENGASLNNQAGINRSRQIDYPNQLIGKVKDERAMQQEMQRPMTVQQLKKYAIQSLEHLQKKLSPKQNKLAKKYNALPIFVSKSNGNRQNNIGTGCMPSLSSAAKRK